MYTVLSLRQWQSWTVSEGQDLGLVYARGGMGFRVSENMDRKAHSGKKSKKIHLLCGTPKAKEEHGKLEF